MRTRGRGQSAHRANTVGHSCFKTQHEMTACQKWMDQAHLVVFVVSGPPPHPPTPSLTHLSDSSLITELLLNFLFCRALSKLRVNRLPFVTMTPWSSLASVLIDISTDHQVAVVTVIKLNLQRIALLRSIKTRLSTSLQECVRVHIRPCISVS